MSNDSLNYAILKYINSIKDADLPATNQLFNSAFEYLTSVFNMEVTPENDELYGNHDLRPLIQFEAYKKILDDKNYFAGTEKGDDEYKERLIKAKGKFFENFINETSESKQASALKLKDEGNNYFRNGDYDSAIEYYTKAIEIWPTKNDFFSNRGLCKFNQEKFEEAVVDYKRSLELDPTAVKIYIRLGLAYTKLDRKDEAIETYKNGLIYDPTSTYLRDPLRVLLEERGETLEEMPNFGDMDFSQMLNDPAAMERMQQVQEMMGGGTGGNPMAQAMEMLQNPNYAAMVQQIMQSPGFGDLMGNMMSSFAGGQMPGFPPQGNQ